MMGRLLDPGCVGRLQSPKSPDKRLRHVARVTLLLSNAEQRRLGLQEGLVQAGAAGAHCLEAGTASALGTSDTLVIGRKRVCDTDLPVCQAAGGPVLARRLRLCLGRFPLAAVLASASSSVARAWPPGLGV